jgi:UDP:flavonoid glycosyltransferase YjiC (YdhE family)
MKIMFTVQGDGRGHMTQAIAAAQTLERQGHEIVAVTIGTNPTRTLPEFFRSAFNDRLRPIASPGFAFQGARGVATLATARQVLSGVGRYYESLRTISDTIERAQPDLIVNFLEPLMGVFNLLQPHPIPVVAVGHQFKTGSVAQIYRFVPASGFASQSAALLVTHRRFRDVLPPYLLLTVWL